MAINLTTLSREFTAQFFLCVFISLAAPQSPLWPLLVFVLWVPFRNAWPATTAHTTSALSKAILGGECHNFGGMLLDVLVQFVGAVLGGYVGFVVVDSNASAPVVAEDISDARAFIIIAVVTAFWATLNFALKGEGFERNLSAAFLWIGTVFALQAHLPGAVGNINTDIGRIIAARIRGDGGLEMNFDGAWTFIIGPIVGLVVAKGYVMAEEMLEKMQCCEVGSNKPQAVPQHEAASGMPMVASPVHHGQHHVSMPYHG